MLDLLSDFISKSAENEKPACASQSPSFMSAFDKTDGVQPGRAKVPLDHVKCWRIMFHVVDLYSSLPREAKNKGFLRRNNFGRVLGGKLTKDTY